jgi:hypothetical protein
MVGIGNLCPRLEAEDLRLQLVVKAIGSDKTVKKKCAERGASHQGRGTWYPPAESWEQPTVLHCVFPRSIAWTYDNCSTVLRFFFFFNSLDLDL